MAGEFAFGLREREIAPWLLHTPSVLHTYEYVLHFCFLTRSASGKESSPMSLIFRCGCFAHTILSIAPI